MEIELKENTYDGPGMSINVSTKESISGSIALDYIKSDNAAEIDKGIRETIKGIQVSVLTMGLGLANMKAKSLYKDLGFNNLTQYIQQLSNETKMDRSNIFSWLRIGEAYIRYQSELEQIGFCDSNGPTKLSYLDRALKMNEKQEVFDNIKNMSLREFKTFSKGQTLSGNPVRKRDRWKINVRGNSIYMDGKLAIILSKKIDPRVSEYFMKVIRVMCEALEKERVMLPVLLRNLREVDRFWPMVEMLKVKMGMK